MPVIMRGKIKWGFRMGGLKKAFMDLILVEINRRINTHIKAIEQDIKTLIRLSFLDSDIADQLREGGQLAADFGILPGEGDIAVNKIAEMVAASCKINKLKIRYGSGKGLTGGIRIRLILDDYSDVLSLKEAYTLFQNRQTMNQDILAWLKWLLLEGNSIIQLPNPGTNKSGTQNTWDVIYGSFRQGKTGKGNSRSGNGLMVKSSRAFRVSSNYSGTADNNWLTRLFSGPDGDAFNLRVRTILERYTA